ncbi:MlaD family protein [Mycobacterium sp. 1274756.6]|uniref:MlaD family protein n=1 Tax=Mycobacterium sp. 1274756.6 TaxID=1834076 RepID=UPI000800AF89|nr:MlaD family protein [Mycobacterium sp. 1274756.6]OBJ71985.1 hypothetical protein A5643_00710 [Mycobacterium sp. 1274756.6]
MGYEIGSVEAVTPSAMHVRVDFRLRETRRLPADVMAVIRSTSILADRSLELVGNYEGGPELGSVECIPLSRSATPKGLSEAIGSATEMLNAITPDTSANLANTVRGLDAATHGSGPELNALITSTSSLLDSPDQVFNDLGSLVINLAELTSLLTELREPLKGILNDATETTSQLDTAVLGATRVVEGVTWIAPMITDVENNLGEETQFTLDAVAVALRKLSAHAPRTANLLNPLPWWINTAANHFNARPFDPIRYRPPMYRIRTPDGVALCNMMNAQTPGSCANVQGQPYAADIALLQYVLTEAARR